MRHIWKMSNGEKIKIKNMTTKHIKNCIALLHKYHSAELKAKLNFSDSLLSENAQFIADQEIDRILEFEKESRQLDEKSVGLFIVKSHENIFNC